jgi:hypothetical protein
VLRVLRVPIGRLDLSWIFGYSDSKTVVWLACGSAKDLVKLLRQHIYFGGHETELVLARRLSSVIYTWRLWRT